MSTRPLFYALTIAGLVTGGLLMAQSSGPASAKLDFDPLLQAQGIACVSGDKTRRLMGYYQKLAAAKTEVRPFPTDVPAGAEAALTPPPLWDNLGTLHFAVSTPHPLAQRYFDQGLKLAYAFNHAEAARAFRQAQRLDPDCAMCHWGEALVLGPNINAPMDTSANAAALAAIARAQALASKASARERDLIAALARRYASDAKAERAVLNAAYAEAMGKVAARYPDDADITLLYVESLMNLSPWDYWEMAGARPKGRTAEILATLEPRDAGKGTAAPTGPSRRHSLLHPHGGSLHRSRPRPALRRQARQPDARRGASGAHAVPHLLPRRPIQGRHRGQPARGGG